MMDKNYEMKRIIKIKIIIKNNQKNLNIYVYN